MTTVALDNRNGLHGAVHISWYTMPQDSVGAYLEFSNHSDKTIQFWGTFGGATAAMYGSNDPSVATDPDTAAWFPLTDLQGNSISKTSAAGEMIIENPRYIRPTVVGGDGTTSINVSITAKRG